MIRFFVVFETLKSTNNIKLYCQHVTIFFLDHCGNVLVEVLYLSSPREFFFLSSNTNQLCIKQKRRKQRFGWKIDGITSKNRQIFKQKKRETQRHRNLMGIYG